MLLLQYDVHNYYIYNQCWADQTQEVCTLSLYLPISIECVTPWRINYSLLQLQSSVIDAINVSRRNTQVAMIMVATARIAAEY